MPLNKLKEKDKQTSEFHKRIINQREYFEKIDQKLHDIIEKIINKKME